MPKLIHQTSEALAGPWLLSHEALLALDSIIDKEAPTLRDLRESTLREAVEEELQEDRTKYPRLYEGDDAVEKARKKLLESRGARAPYAPEKRATTVTFKSGKRVEAETFQQISRMPEIRDELPVGFEVRYVCGNVAAKVSIPTYGHFRELAISVSPETEQNAKELFAVLSGWASSARPNPVQTMWNKVLPFIWGIWFLTLFFAVTVAIPDVDEANRQLGRDLLRQGVKPGDEVKVLERILAIESRYAVPNAARPGVPRWLKGYAVIGAFACILLSFPPKFALGIGKGEKRVKFWKQYTRFVLVTIPATLASWFLWPALQRFAERLF